MLGKYRERFGERYIDVVSEARRTGERESGADVIGFRYCDGADSLVYETRLDFLAMFVQVHTTTAVIGAELG